ncbi:MAG: glutamyl-tRNA reductase [Candidatus Hydrogenedentota bacterium]
MIHMIGLSHKTAEIRMREEFLRRAPTTESLVAGRFCDESVRVATCNRHETYFVTSSADADPVRRHFGDCLGELFAACRITSGSEVVRHLYRVASSIESLVVGETQILGQIKSGEEDAEKKRTIGPYLRRLFIEARRVGAAVRTRTSLGEGSVSVASLAARLTGKIFGSLKGRKLILVGAGEMGRIAAEYFAKAGCVISIAAREESATASSLAADLTADIVPLADLDRLMKEADIIVTAASVTEHLLRRSGVSKALEGRGGRPLFLLDIALPRNIDPDVSDLPGAYLYDIDDLESMALEFARRREGEIMKAEQIVDEARAKWPELERDIRLRPVVGLAYERLKALEASGAKNIPDEEARRNYRLRLHRLFHFTRNALTDADDIDLPFRIAGFERLFRTRDS